MPLTILLNACCDAKPMIAAKIPAPVRIDPATVRKGGYSRTANRVPTVKMMEERALPKPEMEKGKPVTRTFTLRQLVFLTPPQPVKAPPSQYAIFRAGAGQANLETSARLILTAFGKRAFRRPLAANEVERFVWIYKAHT